MDDATRRRLDRARAVLEASRGREHDHRGPGPCPACGGTPLTRPEEHYRRPFLRIVAPVDEEESE